MYSSIQLACTIPDIIRVCMYRVEKTDDPGQLPANLDLYCLQNRLHTGLAW